MIDDLKNDANVNVKRLDIIGYASPEGTLEANKRLSEGRAMALRNYLATQYDFPKNQYHIQFGGENWEGLVKALATVEMDGQGRSIGYYSQHPELKRKGNQVDEVKWWSAISVYVEAYFPESVCRDL